MISIIGGAGYGKSSLAHHIYEEVEEFQDKFWCNFQNPISFDNFGLWLLRKILGDEKYYKSFLLYQKLEDDEMATELVSLLIKRRYLLTMDNIETLEGVLWQPYQNFLEKWLMSGGGGIILITSRNKLELEPYVRCRCSELSGLSVKAGISLLNSKGIKGTDENLKKFVEIADGHPLLLTLTADWITKEEADGKKIEIYTLSDNDLVLFEEIAGPHRNPVVTLGKIFEESFRNLSPRMRTLLLNASIIRYPFSIKMARMISSRNLAEKILRQELVKHSLLLEEKVDGKWLFKFQPLIQRYAQHLLKKEGNYYQAHQRLINYLNKEIIKKINENDLDNNLELLEIIYHYCEVEQYEQASNFLYDRFEFLNLRGYYKVLQKYYEILIPKLLLYPPDKKSKLEASLANLGSVYQALGNYSQALDYYQKTLEIIQQNNYELGKAFILDRIALVYVLQGNLKRAVLHFQQAIEIVQGLEEKHYETIFYSDLALAYDHCKKYEKAIETYHKAIEKFVLWGDRQSEATCLGKLGNIYFRQKKYSEAIQLYEQSLDIARQNGFRHIEALALCDIGILKFKQKKYSEAIKHLQPALDTFKEIGDRYHESICLEKLSLAQFKKNIWNPDINYWKDYNNAIQMKRELGVPLEISNPILGKWKDFYARLMAWIFDMTS